MPGISQIFRKAWGSRAFRFLLVALILIQGAYRSALYFFPLKFAELSSRIELWRGGVQEFYEDGLHGYSRNLCSADPSTQPGASCACVALLPGLGDNAMTWKKVLLWPKEKWPVLAPHKPVHLFAFDLPGEGSSEEPAQNSDYRVRIQAEKLRKTMARLCPHWSVVGNSLGGWVGAWLALDWHEGVAKLLLVDSAGMEPAAKEAADTFSAPSIEGLKNFQRRAYYRPRELPESVWRAAVANLKKNHTRAIMEAQTQEDWLDTRLPYLRLPTIVLWGDADRVIPIEVGKQMRDLIPGAIWREAPQCGHLPQKECPLAVVTAIQDVVGLGAI